MIRNNVCILSFAICKYHAAYFVFSIFYGFVVGIQPYIMSIVSELQMCRIEVLCMFTV